MRRDLVAHGVGGRDRAAQVEVDADDRRSRRAPAPRLAAAPKPLLAPSTSAQRSRPSHVSTIVTSPRSLPAGPRGLAGCPPPRAGTQTSVGPATRLPQGALRPLAHRLLAVLELSLPGQGSAEADELLCAEPAIGEQDATRVHDGVAEWCRPGVFDDEEQASAVIRQFLGELLGDRFHDAQPALLDDLGAEFRSGQEAVDARQRQVR